MQSVRHKKQGIGENAFSRVTAEAYYPAENSTWTPEIMQNYGGNLTWIEKEISTVELTDTTENDTDNTMEEQNDDSTPSEPGEVDDNLNTGLMEEYTEDSNNN